MQLIFTFSGHNDISALNTYSRPRFARAANRCFAGRNIIMPSKVNINPKLALVCLQRKKGLVSFLLLSKMSQDDKYKHEVMLLFVFVSNCKCCLYDEVISFF